MKLTEVAMAYTAYVLSDASRAALAEKFPPKYPEFIGHHITVQFGVDADASEPSKPASVNVVGYVDSGDGLEALVVSVDGTSERPDGNRYHITWSLDRDKYKPVDSNELIRTKHYTITLPFPIRVTPAVL